MSAIDETTTIDSLQIEIHSNSTNAAEGISALATSLGKLKSNGSIGVAVKNLNNLSKALKDFTPVASNAKKLGSLADAASKLSNAGSFARVINQLHKLPSALKGLENMELGGIDSKFDRIASASSKLSGIKSSGLSSMVNSLGKLGDVTKSLDDDTINAFANKIEKLNDKLAPLSTKMVAVSSGFRTINTNASKASTGVRNLGSRVNVTTLNMATMITTIQGVVSALRPIIGLLSSAIGEAIEWDGIASRFGRGFGEQAQDVYDRILRLNKEMDINVQQFMQYSSTYASMLTGYGLSSKDASNMALGYMELTYDIWAGYNDIYKSLDDAAIAVRSAIASEVEPIRKAGITITQATLKETAANYGLEISIENMTEAQKSYLIYLTMVDKAYAQNLVGSYARELNTAEGQMRTFRQQLKSLAQSFGALFLPILVKIMPWLQAFVDLLGDAIMAVANFFGIEIQKVDFSNNVNFGDVSENLDEIDKSADNMNNSLDNVNDNLKDTANAIKDLKNATIGIDELNIISPPAKNNPINDKDGDGYDDSWKDVLGGMNSLWNESIFKDIQRQVDDIKEKIKDMLPAIGIIGGSFAAWRLLNLLTDIDDVFRQLKNLDPTIKGLAKGLALAAITVAVGALVWDFTGAYLQGGDEKDLLKALGTTVLGTALAAFLAGKVGAGLVLVTSGIVTLTRLGVEISKGNVEWTDPEAIVTAFVGIVETAIGGALTWKAIGPAVKSAVTTLCGKVGAWLTGGGLATITSAIPYVAIAAAIIGLITLAFVDYDFTEVSRKVGEKVGQALKWAFDNLTPLGLAIKLGKFLMEELDVDSIWGAIKFIFTPEAWKEVIVPKITDIIGAVAKWIGEKLSNLAGNIGEIQDGFLEGLGSVFNIDLAKALDFLTINDIGDLLSCLTQPTMFYNAFKSLGEQILLGLWEGVKERWPDFGEWVEGLFNDFVGFCKSLLGIESPSTVFAEIGKYCVEGLIGGITSKASELWEATKSWCGDIVDNVKKFFGIASPSKEFKEIGRYCVDGLVNGFNVKDALLAPIKTMWNNAKNWWETKKGNFSTYVPSIGDIKSKISSAWNTAKTWYNTKKSAMSTYTPNIGSIYEKVKERWDNAREWYNKKKSAMNTYTPSIGSIKDKLVSAWNTAKSWWNKNVKLSIPSLSFKVTYTTSGLSGLKKAIVDALNLPGWPKLSFAKNGGIFDAGSLIWAGEAGAEIVANAGGGKTGVMNVDQMKEAVYEGVYAAVIAAMRATNGGSGEQAVNVYLDSKQITSSVEKRQRERGASIMGSQVYSY